MNSLPLLTPAEATHLHTQLSGPMAQFHLSINCSKTCMPEMMIDIGIFCRGQEGNFRDARSGCFQKEQIFHLHPFLRVNPSVSQVVSCARVQTAQKWKGRILKHGLGFAESTDISTPLSRVKVSYTTSQMTISKAHPTPWITTIPTLFWWTTAHQRSGMEPPSSAWPWKSTSRSSAQDTGVSRCPVEASHLNKTDNNKCW